jgi:hypothetical protein
MNCFQISFVESDLSWDNHSMSESSILNYDYNDGYSYSRKKQGKNVVELPYSL